MDVDGSTMNAGVPPPAGDDAPGGAPGVSGRPPSGPDETPRGSAEAGGRSDEAPSLRAQLGATIGAARRLIQAHINLAKAEISEIAGSVGRMVGLFAGAFVLVLFAGVLLFVGGILFLGEALFGSIGWGLLLGVLLLVDLALVAVLVALDVTGKRVGTAFGLAAAIGIIVGLVLGFDLTHRGWLALGDAVASPFDASQRTTSLAVGSLGAIGALLGLAAGIRGGGEGLVKRLGAGLLAGALAGVLLGWLTSIQIALNVGAALGVLVALIAWPILAGLDLMRTGVDGEALKKKFTPQASIDLTKETIEWVRARTPLVPKS